MIFIPWYHCSCLLLVMIKLLNIIYFHQINLDFIFNSQHFWYSIQIAVNLKTHKFFLHFVGILWCYFKLLEKCFDKLLLLLIIFFSTSLIFRVTSQCFSITGQVHKKLVIAYFGVKNSQLLMETMGNTSEQKNIPRNFLKKIIILIGLPNQFTRIKQIKMVDFQLMQQKRKSY